MNNFDRNTRTLIVSFLVAIFALIPLRFVEVGNEQSLLNQPQVLGESVVATLEPTTINEMLEVKLEAPYDTLESCIEIQNISETLEESGLIEKQILAVIEEMKLQEVNFCE